MSIAAIAVVTNSLSAVPLPCYTHTKPHNTPVNVQCCMSIAAIAIVPIVSLPYLSPVTLTVSPTVPTIHQLMYSAVCLLLLLL